MSWTTTDLIAAVRVRAQVPDDGGDPTDAEILRIATEELSSRFVGIIRSTRENYLVTYADTALADGTTDYALPRDADGDSLRDVWLVDSADRTTALRQVDLTDAHLFGGRTGFPAGYYLRGRHLVIVPEPTSEMTGYSLRMFYYRRPSKLVAVSSCFPVASKTSTQVVVTGTPSWTSGSPIDIVQADPPFAIVVDDNDATRSSSTFTLVSSAPTTDVSVGDYVCAHGETCIPPVPDVMWAALVAATAAQIRIDEKDYAGAQALMATRDDYIKAALESMQPRVDGRAKPIINLGSALRRGRRW